MHVLRASSGRHIFFSAPCDVAGESNVMSHSVLVSACVEGKQWQADFAVLRAMSLVILT